LGRTATGLGVRDLADAAEVSPSTVTRFEAGEGVQTRSLEAMQRALEERGVTFISEDDFGGPGVRVKKRSV
jgi:transcriptional regulator with XRE-family HTH domain